MSDQKPTGSVDLDNVRHAVEVLEWARSERAKVEERVKELEDAAKDTIRKAMGGEKGTATAGYLDGRQVVNWTRYEKNQFNQKKFREDHPTLFDQYYGKVPARSFNVLDADG